MADDKIIIKIEGDSAKLKTSINSADKRVSVLRKSAKGLGTALKASAGIAAAGFAALTAGVGASIAIFREQEQAEIRTRKTIEATGGAAGLTAKEIFKMASELQKVTTFGDETIISGQNMLLTFKNIGKDVFPRATEAMLDMSTAMGTDLQSSAIQLGKALNDPVAGISALSRVGITFTDEQKKLIKTMSETGDAAGAQSIILKELESQFGGVSKAATEGTGAFIQTKNLLGDVAEEIGRAVLPAVNALNKALSSFLKDNDNLINTTVKFWGKAIADAFSPEDPAINLKAIADEVKTLDEEIKAVEDARAARRQSGAGDLFTDLEEENSIFGEALARRSELIAEQREIEALLEEENNAKKIEVESTFQKNKDKVQDKANKQFVKKRKAIEKKELTEEQKFNLARLNLQKQYTDVSLSLATNLSNLSIALTGKSNKILFGIEKAASIAQAIVATNLGAAKALALGPPQGPILAGITTAAGYANVATIAATAVKGFAKGGLVEGGIAGRDSVPAMMQQGELVVPRQNFEEVINSTRAAREAANLTDESAASSSVAVELSFKDDVGDFIEAIVLERRSLNVGAI